jgi:hypothetical protein
MLKIRAHEFNDNCSAFKALDESSYTIAESGEPHAEGKTLFLECRKI